MKIEVRNDSVQISGYVNAVERESKILHTKDGKPFVEKIKSGTFKRSLDRHGDVKLLLNHDKNRVLGSTKNNLELREDNIGLKATATITDADIINKARNNELVGWSFGFYALRDVKTQDEQRNLEVRDVSELDLFEVSILDNTKVPAYDGTLIEARSLDSEDEIVELRVSEEEVETEIREDEKLNNDTNDNEESKVEDDKKELNYEYSNRYYKARIVNK